MDMLLAGIVKLTNQSCEVCYKVYAVSFVTVNAIFHNYMDTKVEKWWGKFSCQKNQHNDLPNPRNTSKDALKIYVRNLHIKKNNIK